jgi:hypothetical protein
VGAARAARDVESQLDQGSRSGRSRGGRARARRDRPVPAARASGRVRCSSRARRSSRSSARPRRSTGCPAGCSRSR